MKDYVIIDAKSKTILYEDDSKYSIDDKVYELERAGRDVVVALVINRSTLGEFRDLFETVDENEHPMPPKVSRAIDSVRRHLGL